MTGCRVSSGGDKNVEELDGGDGCKTLSMDKMPPNSSLEMVKVENVMFGVFYHKKKYIYISGS